LKKGAWRTTIDSTQMTHLQDPSLRSTIYLLITRTTLYKIICK